MARKLEVQIVGDASSLQRALGKATNTSNKFGGSLKTLGKVAAVGVGGAFVGLGLALKNGYEEMAEAQKVAAQTGAVLKSTGGSANVTAKEVDSLAQSLSRMSGVDDEAIASGENMLLTFTNIRNEVGKGNDVFNQATATLLDMSTALGTDMNKSAIQLGKALNDPVKGITALTRVGVTFTAGQRAQIKEMVAAGDAMGAQKLILAELNKEFGGSAKAAGETFPGQLAKLRNSFDEVTAKLTQALLPYLERFVDWLNQNMPTIQRVITTTMDTIIAVVAAVAPVIGTLIGWFQRLANFSRAHWAEVQAAAQRVIAWYQTNIAPAIQNVVNAIKAIWDRFGADILNILQRSFGVIRTIIQTTLGNIASVIQAFLAILRGDWGKAWSEISEIPGRTLRGVVNVIRGLFGLWLAAAKALAGAIIQGLTAGLAGVAGVITSALSGAAAAARNLAVGVGQAIIGGVVDGLSGLFNAVKNKAESMIKGALSSLNPFSPVEHGGVIYIGEPIVRGAIKGLENLSSSFTAKTNEVTKKAVEGALTAVRDGQDKFKDAWASYGDAAVAAFDDIASKIQTPAEKALATMHRLREAGEIKTAVTEARTGLAEAQAGGDPAAILQAQKTLDEALYRQKEYGLQQRANLERAKMDEQIEVNRLKFEQWLATRTVQQQQELTKEGTGQKKIVGHIASYGPAWAQAGRDLGAQLAAGLRDARGWVMDAANELAAAMSSAIGAASQARSSAKTISQNIQTKIEGRAGGGPVRGGTPYIVGERGPELFVPNTAGIIQPNQSPRNIPGGVIFHQYVAGSVVTERQLVEMVREELIRLGRYNAGGVLGGVG